MKSIFLFFHSERIGIRSGSFAGIGIGIRIGFFWGGNRSITSKSNSKSLSIYNYILKEGIVDKKHQKRKVVSNAQALDLPAPYYEQIIFFRFNFSTFFSVSFPFTSLKLITFLNIIKERVIA